MMELSIEKGVFLNNGNLENRENPAQQDIDEAKKGTITYGILNEHNTSGDINNLKIKFDAMASHDITYVGIIQTARCSGLKSFPLPYVMTNCHNSLSAVGGTINEDDHVFGLSAAKKYGGIFVPPHQAVIHQYMREMFSGCGKMILGSDSHTRYGALGTMGFGEGGPELVKQLLNRTYDFQYPEVIGVYLEGSPKPGVGPQDVALALVREVFEKGYVKNKILEFIGPGISNLSVDYRNGIDVMTTETTCLSSIWQTDDRVKEYFLIHNRIGAYKLLKPLAKAYYDGLIKIDLSKIEPMIALPFHPSNAFTIKELKENPSEILREIEELAKEKFKDSNLQLPLVNKIINGKLHVDQGIIAGCAGGSYENLYEASLILENKSIGNDHFNLSIYPASQPIYMELLNSGAVKKLMKSGAIIRSAFCGPCFGAGETPANKNLSIRHTTRNFPNREGSKPGNGQLSAVALMDARSIAATALNKGELSGADEVMSRVSVAAYSFDEAIYNNRIKNNYKKADTKEKLIFGPNIKDWPKMMPLPDNLLLGFASVIHDPVTTTDELIPSGETSSYRSNPLGLAEFTLSRKDPEYVGRAKGLLEMEKERQKNLGKMSGYSIPNRLGSILGKIADEKLTNEDDFLKILETTGIGSLIFAVKPGDGSAREQAASCQKVLGGWANIASEYATKRYRSNLINWGIIPFTTKEKPEYVNDDFIFIPGIKAALKDGKKRLSAYLINENKTKTLELELEKLSEDERKIILSGCLMNYYASME